MKYYRFFDELTGSFHPMSVKATSLEDAIASQPLGHNLIVGSFDHLCQRVDIEKANAARAVHDAAHAENVARRRSDHYYSPSVPGLEFMEPPKPIFLASADMVVPYQPPAPSPDHEWNAETGRWVWGQTAVDRQDAARTAKARIESLEIQERPLLRRLALDSTDAAARTSLAAIDTEIAELRKMARAE